MILAPSPSSPSPPRAVLIDHTAFPYLIDNIFRLAPHASLIKLQLVSRAFLARADAILARHVYFRLLQWPPLDNYVYEGVGPGPDRPRIPGLAPYAMWAWRERYAAILANTRVVDFEHVEDSENPNLEELSAGVRLCRALANVDTMCLRLGSRSQKLRTPVRARRVIIRLDMWGALQCKAVTGPPCYGVEQLVLNVGDVFGGVFPAECVTAFCTPSLREIVVIFDTITFWPPEHNQDESRAWILRKILRPMASLLPAVKVKFVNAVVLYPFVPDVQPGQAISLRPLRRIRGPNVERDFYQYILSIIQMAFFLPYPTAENIQWCEQLMDKSVSFHTLKAYRASIPAADFDLETMKHIFEWDLGDDDDDNQDQGHDSDDDDDDDWDDEDENSDQDVEE